MLGLEGGDDAGEAPVTRSFLGLERPAFRPPSPPEPAAGSSSAGKAGSAPGALPDPRAQTDLRGQTGVRGQPGHREQTGPGGEEEQDGRARPVPEPPTFGESRRGDPLPVSVPVPELEREILGAEKSDRARAFPVERAILVSLALHVLLFFILVSAPSGGGGALNLFPGMTPREKTEEEKIPIVFRAAPGPERENQRASDFSDKNRRAGGGDRSKPKSDMPFAPVLPGKEGLDPGGARRVAAAPAAGGRAGVERPGTGSAPAERSEISSTSADAWRGSPPAPPGSGAEAGAGAAGRSLPNLDEAIREAARRVGESGQGGAGMPNPGGGFVDSGPLSFETSWYDWGPYADEMVRRIKLHWDVPKLAELGWKGKLTIHFDIRADGSVSGATMVSTSGIPPFDYAAMQAILKSNPFRPLPKDLLKAVPGKEKEGVTVTFFYNIRPGKEGTQEGTP